MKVERVAVLLVVLLVLIIESESCRRRRRSCFRLNCPGGSRRTYRFTADRGHETAVVRWDRPTCNCGSMNGDPLPMNTRLGEGSREIKYHCRDNCGHSGNCFININVHVTRCPRLSTPIHGRIRTCGAYYGTRCEYTCDTGYSRSTAYPYCNGQGKWDGSMSCAVGSCSGNPPSVANSDVTCSSGNRYRSVCEYRCHQGHRIPRSLQNYHRPSCQSSLTWSSGTRPSCYVDKDPDVQYCPGDMVVKTGVLPVSVDVPAPIFTARGERLTPSCSHTGTTDLQTTTQVGCSATDPELARSSSCSFSISVQYITCDPLAPPTNGQIVGTCESTYESTCTYTCVEGYSASTATQVTCTDSGQWDVQPECEVIQCPEPPQIVNGDVSCTTTDFTYGTNCEYSCDSGYDIPNSQSDSAVLRCDASRQWEPDTKPECWADQPPTVLGCPGDKEILSETAQTQVDIQMPTFRRAEDSQVLDAVCNFPTTATLGIGDHDVICTGTDDEMGTHSTCRYTISVILSSCQPKQIPVNGFLGNCDDTTGSQCYYGCNDGYNRIGPNPVNCTIGQWTGEIGCTVVKCTGAPPDVTNGYVNCTGDTYGNVCTYSCRHGYVIPKSQRHRARFACQASGSWEHGGNEDPPECWVDEPPTVSNCSDGLNVSTTDLETTVTIPKPIFSSVRGDNIPAVCPQYQNDQVVLGLGTHRVLCTGTDVETGRGSQCTFNIQVDTAVCPALEPPKNGLLSCAQLFVVTQCGMMCPNGYDIPRGVTSTGLFMCSGGVWSSTDVPDCVQQRIPTALRLPAELYYNPGSTSCADMTDDWLQGIKEQFSNFLQATLGAVCADPANDCSAENVEITCGETSRKKRDVSDASVYHEKFLEKVKAMRQVSYLSTVDGAMDRHRRQVVDTKLTVRFTIVVGVSPNVTYNDNAYYDNVDKMLDIVNQIEKDVQNDTILPWQSNYDLELLSNTLELDRVVLQCEHGFFENPQTTSCATCPSGFFVNYTGETPVCSECPIGMYQEESGQLQCEQCPLGTSSVTTGARNVTQCIEIDECDPSPCDNNATCVDGFNDYECECRPGFAGKTCSDFDCTYHECQNNGTCISFNYGYNCTCVEGFSGNRCQHQQVDGGWSTWGEYTNCSAPCGGGERNRTRTCTNPTPEHGGRGCVGAESETGTCNTQGCLVDGQWGDWSGWSTCSQSCGGGKQNRTRHCDNPAPAFGGLTCEGVRHEGQQCNTQACPVNGGVGPWSAWSLCTKSCDGGEQVRNRSCDNPPPAHGGAGCQESLRAERQCNNQSCPPPPPCDLQPCLNNATCINNGSEYVCNCPLGFGGTNCSVHDCRENNCQNNATCVGHEDGYNCLCAEMFSGEFCQNEMVDGSWGQWEQWSDCSVSCGGGQRSRYRSCDNPSPMYGGKQCVGISGQVRGCNWLECPVCRPLRLDPPQNGVVNCTEDIDKTTCIAKCQQGYGFSTGAIPSGGVYECGKDTLFAWTNQINPNHVLPACTEAVIDVDQDITTTVDVDGMACTDENKMAVASQASSFMDFVKNPSVSVKCKNVQRRKRWIDGSRLLRAARAVPDGEMQIVTSVTFNASEILDDTLMSTLGDYAEQLVDSGNVTFTVNGTVYTVDPNITSISNCSAGSIEAFDSVLCVKCRAGTFYTENANNAGEIACSLCPAGYYQPELGQTDCYICDMGYTTGLRGAENQTQCAPCTNGTYMYEDPDVNIGRVCLPCQLGFYQTQDAQTSCIQCPDDMTTVSTGSTSQDQCVTDNTTTTTTTAATTTAATTTDPQTTSSETPSTTETTTRSEMPTTTWTDSQTTPSDTPPTTKMQTTTRPQLQTTSSEVLSTTKRTTSTKMTTTTWTESESTSSETPSTTKMSATMSTEIQTTPIETLSTTETPTDTEMPTTTWAEPQTTSSETLSPLAQQTPLAVIIGISCAALIAMVAIVIVVLVKCKVLGKASCVGPESVPKARDSMFTDKDFIHTRPMTADKSGDGYRPAPTNLNEQHTPFGDYQTVGGIPRPHVVPNTYAALNIKQPVYSNLTLGPSVAWREGTSEDVYEQIN